MSANNGLSVAPGTGTRQPDSKPGDRPGYTRSPLFVFTDAHTLRALSTCAAVRQSGPSPALHASTAGSNLHERGSLTIPSLTPSFSSHAATTAFANIVFFSGATRRSGFFNISTCSPTCDTLRCTWL